MNLNVNYKKSKLKISASVLAIAATLGVFGDVLGMDKRGDINPDGKSVLTLVNGDLIWLPLDVANEPLALPADASPVNRPLKVVDQGQKLNTSNDKFLINQLVTPLKVSIESKRDVSENSVSEIYCATNKYGLDKKERRILSLDGGGIRGVYEAVELAVLEAIINHDCNAEFREKIYGKNALRLADIFDVACGTSTGSILAGGLFYGHKEYSALYLLNLYANYGFKIFDECSRVLKGANAAKYGKEGIKELLIANFGNCSLGDAVGNAVDKKLYIGTFNATTNEPHMFSTDASNKMESHIALYKTIRASCAAPVFFPAEKILIGNDKIKFKDGGLAVNYPGFQVYLEDAQSVFSENTAIYSFGCGYVKPTPSDETDVSAVTAAAELLLGEFMPGQINTAIKNSKNMIGIPGTSLNYFVRIQPLLEEGKDALDDTSPQYINYAIEKSLAVTKGAVFFDMVKHLGFNMPDNDELDKIHLDLKIKLTGLSSAIYGKLSDLEKQLIIKKIIDLDFDFYHKSNVNGKSLTSEQKDAFLHALLSAIEIHDKQMTYANQLLGILYPTQNYTIQEYVKRGMEFHKITKGLSKITVDGITNRAKEIATQICEEFKGNPGGVCVQGSNKYEKDNSPYIDVISSIYWKNKLSTIENSVTKQQLTALLQAIVECENEEKSSRQMFFEIINLRATRITQLKLALERYIDKKFPIQK